MFGAICPGIADAKLGQITLEELSASSPWIVTGRVVKVHEVPDAWSGVYGLGPLSLSDATVAEVEVTRIIRGDPSARRLVVLNWRGGDCGHPWVEANVEEVLLFLWEQDLQDPDATCDDAEPTATFIRAIEGLRRGAPFLRPTYQGVGALPITNPDGRWIAWYRGELRIPERFSAPRPGGPTVFTNADLQPVREYVPLDRLLEFVEREGAMGSIPAKRVQRARCPWGRTREGR